MGTKITAPVLVFGPGGSEPIARFNSGAATEMVKAACEHAGGAPSVSIVGTSRDFLAGLAVAIPGLILEKDTDRMTIRGALSTGDKENATLTALLGALERVDLYIKKPTP